MDFQGDYIDVYNSWKSENSGNLNSQTAAYNAAYDICVDYEKPDDMKNKGEIRGELAKLIYADLIK